MIRKYKPGDELMIGQIYHDAVHELTREDYTEEQRNAWATPIEGDDAWAEKWRRRCDRKQPWVAVVDGKVAGFIEFEADGHIDCTYVSPVHAGKGHMSAIMERIFQEARWSNISRLYAEVSITARPFFERHGFRVVRDNPHKVRGVPILNYIMECWLHPDPG
ncbi:MAG: GNAT family N-acetyltransferase [Cyanobacteria bacterium J06598_3]